MTSQIDAIKSKMEEAVDDNVKMKFFEKINEIRNASKFNVATKKLSTSEQRKKEALIASLMKPTTCS